MKQSKGTATATRMQVLSCQLTMHCVCNTLKGKCIPFPKARSFNDCVPEDVPAHICILDCLLSDVKNSVVAFLNGVLVLAAAIQQVTDCFYVKPASHTVLLNGLPPSLQAQVFATRQHR